MELSFYLCRRKSRAVGLYGLLPARTAVAVSVQETVGHALTFRGLRYGGFEAPVFRCLDVTTLQRCSPFSPLSFFSTSMDSSSICRIRDTYRAIIAFEALGLTHSNTSKVIASAERQRLIKRRMDKDDKRRMFFTLTPGGEERLATLKSDTMELPELLR